MFNEKEILDLKTYCQSITNRPRPIESQEYKREGVFMWCDDWEIIELCKYLFHGREAYYGDPPPRRLAHNPLWSKDDISQKAEKLIADLKTADAIIAAFKERRNGNGA